MFFKPTKLKIILTIIFFILLLFVDQATTCMGGLVICDPPQNQCAMLISSLEENRSLESFELAHFDRQGITVEACEQMECRPAGCGGIGGFGTIITGSTLFYIIYSLVQKKKNS